MPSHAPRRARSALIAVAAGVAVLSLAAHLGLPGLGEALTYLLPATLLLGVLATRRYPGERALLAALTRRPSNRRRPQAEASSGRARADATVPRGGRLIATSLAVRPPPAARACTNP
ncbi:MAG TPA: hypothetical protein VG366_05675 [Solirubrobacteraceae bacterium]|nr:hypothetical protein [Solirubrobacteraceae bacterium]